MKQTLPISLDYLFGHEGGYVNNPSDPGGPTKYGITHKTLAAHRGVVSVSARQVQELSRAEAEEIYRKSYWSQSGGDLLPAGVDHVVFDMGVNAGPATAVKILQRILGLKGKDVDGIVGVKTADLADKWPRGVVDLIERYSAARIEYYQKLRTWEKFGNGWSARVRKSEEEGVTLALGHTVTRDAGLLVQTTPKAQPEPEKARKDPLTYIASAGPVLGVMMPAFDGNGPVQWALGAVMVIAAVAVVVMIMKRKREAEA